ncbi:helix-turn-helix domain-containing protein [Actinacidiphila epipremni]|uniref:PucR family transcriptional regulator n=1 Tax=Actinacidiphila epipremni TaxID=2053013 RepID=A0ABX0ZRV9_9ACTN|nr:helix-turn-helix domain-containing protein [Actinacidiphila epipremni]NJP45356.1 PucR family transcriptional regulator [Actinacidiphila epipremni]
MTQDGPAGAGGGGLGAVNALIEAAGRGGRELGRRLVSQLGPGSWVMALDRLGGARYAEPPPAEERAAALAGGCERLWRRPGSVLLDSGGHTVLLQTLPGYPDLVLAAGRPGPMDAAHRQAVNTTAGLLKIIYTAAREQREREAAVNGAVLRLLLAGQADSAAEVLAGRGGLPAGPVRVYRAQAAASAGEAVLELVVRAVGRDGLTALADGQIIAVVTAEGAADARLRGTLAGVACRRLHVGASDPAPLARGQAAYREAGHALRAGRAAGRSFTVYGELAEQRLLGLIPQARLLRWAAALLRPVREHPDERRLTEALFAWLNAHGRTSTAAAELGVDRKTVERRVRLCGALLGADLHSEGVRVRLHLALAALDRAGGPRYGPEPLHPEPARPERDCPVGLLGAEKGLAWAAAVLEPLDRADPAGLLRRTLRVWLERHGDHRGTAEELGVHRNTVAKRVGRVEALTGQPLDYVGNRAELYLALVTDQYARAAGLPRPAA